MAALPPYLRSTAGGLELLVHVQPGAKCTEIADEHGDRLKIRRHAPPVDGKANKTLLAFVAALLDLPKRGVSIVAGEKSRDKTLLLGQCDPAAVMARLHIRET